jgi:hypothetical protein
MSQLQEPGGYQRSIRSIRESPDTGEHALCGPLSNIRAPGWTPSRQRPCDSSGQTDTDGPLRLVDGSSLSGMALPTSRKALRPVLAAALSRCTY